MFKVKKKNKTKPTTKCTEPSWAPSQGSRDRTRRFLGPIPTSPPLPHRWSSSTQPQHRSSPQHEKLRLGERRRLRAELGTGAHPTPTHCLHHPRVPAPDPSGMPSTERGTGIVAVQQKAMGCWAQGDPTPLDGTGWPRCPPGPRTELSAAVCSGAGMVLCGDARSEALGKCDPTASSHHSCGDSEAVIWAPCALNGAKWWKSIGRGAGMQSERASGERWAVGNGTPQVPKQPWVGTGVGAAEIPPKGP